MSLQVIIRPEAELDIATAQVSYEMERTGLGVEFRGAVGRAVNLISERPLLYVQVLRKIRRALLVRFPFGLYYVPEQRRVVVLACIHAQRDPKLIRSVISRRRT